VIQLSGAHRQFKVGGQTVHALDRVDLTIETGEYLSIMGPSGSGKSTLLHVLGLLDRLDDGRYLLAGRDTTELDDDGLARLRRDHIGFIFQFFHLVPRLTAAANVELPLVLSGVDPAERRERVAVAMAAYGLEARMHHRPDQLSGGQRQRVAIARAAIMRPQLLLADEPTGNLDRASGHEVVEILERLHQDGLTLVVVTHDPELGQRAPRQVRMLDGGIMEPSSET